MKSLSRSSSLSFVMLLAMLCAMVGPSQVFAANQATPSASPVSAPPQSGDSLTGAVDLDVLVIGAHPDDEAFGLATYGQWNEYDDVNVGVVTVTRGEGGGNAVGTEEGPALGLLREGEERNAVSSAGIENIYNLDKVDFYYTVSAPLTEETWGYDDTLARVVRVIRETRPNVIITMNPAPVPGQHGHHQMAARLAIAGYEAAADPNAFPEQITDEGLSTWSVGRIFLAGATGEGGTGESCATTFVPAEPTDIVYGVWGGRASARNDGLLWSQVARTSQKSYASQGWAVFPDASPDPAETGCDYFTLIDSRTPLSDDPGSPTAMLEGAAIEPSAGLPLGSELSLASDVFTVVPGGSVDVTATLVRPDADADESPIVSLVTPDGWTLAPDNAPFTEDADGQQTAMLSVSVPEDAKVNTRYRLEAHLDVEGGEVWNALVVQVVPPVVGVLAPLPQVAQFQDWVAEVGVAQLDNLIAPVVTLGSGESRDVTIDLRNASDSAQDGTVALELPAGFSVDATSKPFSALAPGTDGTVSFIVTNTDATLPTANEGGEGGDYAFTITTTVGSVSSERSAALEIVPVTQVEQAAAAPELDGVISADEYPGEAIDLSRVWEGDAPDSAADASGNANITWGEDGIYVAVTVQDDTLGTVLPEADAKRHWRTDSVEIAIDPLGTSENTSSTYKVGVFPVTTEGPPAAYRDADAHQGPVSETSPGFKVASTVSEPYSGYVIETFIPYADLPADIDPDNATMNIFIYDSDTQDLTGQTRLGWSTWGGVQGDPYRWGKTAFAGYTPTAAARTTPDAPIMPLDATKSVDSPLSILQSSQDGVGLAGMPSVPVDEGIAVTAPPLVERGNVGVEIAAGSAGTVKMFVLSDSEQAPTPGSGSSVESGATVGISTALPEGVTSGTLLISFEREDGSVQALSVPFGD